MYVDGRHAIPTWHARCRRVRMAGMFHAIQSPLFKMIAAGAAALSLTAMLAHPHVMPSHHLSLHAPVHKGYLYLTAWEHGDVVLRYDHAPAKITLTQEAWINDGCKWRGTETLVPVDDHTFAYHYEETILSCVAGATPCIKTPRAGFVAVDE